VAGWILELDRGQGIPFEGNYSGPFGWLGLLAWLFDFVAGRSGCCINPSIFTKW
jgi:hypothetical protein